MIQPLRTPTHKLINNKVIKGDNPRYQTVTRLRQHLGANVELVESEECVYK